MQRWMEELRARQHDELEALTCIHGDCSVVVEYEASEIVCVLSLCAADPDVTNAKADLHIILPAQYPDAPPVLSISCPWASVEAVERMKFELDAVAQERTSGHGGGGCECLLDVSMRLCELLADEKRSEVARTADASATSVESEPALQEMVLHIDHMNNPTPYLKLLQVARTL